MRTKALLGLAALAVGLSTAVADNVYSVNVVGYVTVPLHAGKLSLVSLPLAPVDGNFSINNTVVLDNSQDYANLVLWTPGGWDTAPTWYGQDLTDPDPPFWSDDRTITNGTSFFISAAAEGSVTFVGQVPQGTASYNWVPGLSAVANVFPVATNFPGNTIGNDYDGIVLWDQATSSWNTDWVYYGADLTDPDPPFWTNNGGPGDNVNGPMLNPGEGFFYQGSGTVSFTKTFTVQ
jgi:hypothetical protein